MKMTLILRTTLWLVVVAAADMHSQQSYTDKGHWIGFRGGYFPSPDHIGVQAIYEYRFDKYWSAPFDITSVQLSDGLGTFIAGGFRLRIPFAQYSRNIYGQVGIGSGSLYPVAYYAFGIEYALLERLSIMAQYRRYSPNFDSLHPHNNVYALGLNFDITPGNLRQSYLLP